MSRRRVWYNNYPIYMIVLFCVFSMILLTAFPSIFSSGVRTGLALCSEIIIPSMFPFFVLSSFMLRSGAIDFIGKKLNKVFEKIFALSGKSASVFLLSLFSGFPVGGKTVSLMLERNEIKKSDAQRLMLCCVNAGPAFTVSAVGVSMLGSKKAGIIILASLTVSSVVILFLSRWFVANEENEVCLLEGNSHEKLSSSLVNAVSDSTKSLLSVSAWILLFSCLCTAAESIGFIKEHSLAFRAIFEVSIGSEKASLTGNIPMVAAVIGWSGLCVHCQVFSAVMGSGVKKRLFFLSKILHCAMSATVCDLLLKIFPCTVSVFSNNAFLLSSGFSSNAPAAAGLLLMSAILISDLETSRKVC